MNNKIIFALLNILLVSGFISGCATKVDRIKVEETIDLSGRWNDTDARVVSEELIKNCLDGAWLSNFNKASGRNPVVIVGAIVNRTSEHINPSVFIKNLEKDLINSGKATFVASKDERVTIREERQEQQTGQTDPQTIKPAGKETGADFMLQGNINAVTDEIKGKAVTLYQVNLELVDLTTNQISWLGQTQLKKLVKKTSYSY